MNQQVTTLVALGLSGLLAGCALAPGAKPEDMGADAHEREAVAHSDMARKHAGEESASVSSNEGLGSHTPWGASAAPSETHDVRAERHRLHAEDHLVAAETLREVEEDACGSVPPGVRGSCPLLGPVVSTEAGANGARITVLHGTDMKALVAQIRCHIAIGNTEGLKGSERCPLYVRGVAVQQVGPNEIELTASGGANIRELQNRVATQIGD